MMDRKSTRAPSARNSQYMPLKVRITKAMSRTGRKSAMCLIERVASARERSSTAGSEKS